MKKFIIVLCFFIMACAPKLYVTPAKDSPDRSQYYAVVTKTKGITNLITTQVIRMTPDGKSEVISDHAAEGKNIFMTIGSSVVKPPAK